MTGSPQPATGSGADTALPPDLLLSTAMRADHRSTQPINTTLSYPSNETQALKCFEQYKFSATRGTCPPSSLNESRIEGLPKLDSLLHTDSEVRVKCWVQLTCLACYRKKMNSRGCNSAHSRIWNSSPPAHSLAWLSAPLWARAATAPNIQCQTAAQHQWCLSVALHVWQDPLWAAPCPAHLDLTHCLLLTHSQQINPLCLTPLCLHALRHLGSTHVPEGSANHAGVCTAMHLCACCIIQSPFLTWKTPTSKGSVHGSSSNLQTIIQRSQMN